MSLTTSAVVGLTTPFAYAPTCADIPLSTTSFVSSFRWNDYSTTTIEVRVSDPADDRFAECQPSGWDIGDPQTHFTFSPAVCPSGWTAYSLVRLHDFLSIGYCCDSGYTLDWPVSDGSIDNIASPACFRDISATAPPSETTLSADVRFPNGMQVHNAWHIAWAASDTSTLSPVPPGPTCGRPVLTWVPGEPLDQGECNDSHNDGVKLDTPIFWFLVIGLPLILIAIVASCCLFCFCTGRKKRTAAHAAAYYG